MNHNGSESANSCHPYDVNCQKLKSLDLGHSYLTLNIKQMDCLLFHFSTFHHMFASVQTETGSCPGILILPTWISTWLTGTHRTLKVVTFSECYIVIHSTVEQNWHGPCTHQVYILMWETKKQTEIPSIVFFTEFDTTGK